PGCAEVVAASAASRVERPRTALEARVAVDRTLITLVGFARTLGCARSQNGKVAGFYAIQGRSAGPRQPVEFQSRSFVCEPPSPKLPPGRRGTAAPIQGRTSNIAS